MKFAILASLRRNFDCLDKDCGMVLSIVVPLPLVLITSMNFWVYFGYNLVTRILKAGIGKTFKGQRGLVIL